jgi:hypothetical protein
VLYGQRGESNYRWIFYLCIIILIIFAIPSYEDGMVTEFYEEKYTDRIKELKEEISCDLEIPNGGSDDWAFTELGEDLRIVSEIASNVDLRFTADTDEGIVIDTTNNIININQTLNGPTLVLTLKNINPIEDILGSKATTTGFIDIFHEYDKEITQTLTRQVPGKVLRWFSLWRYITEKIF